MRKQYFVASFIISSLLVPALAFAAFNTDLRRGDTGPLVVELQQFLITRGHLAADNATGYFGPLTFSAVQGFQSARSVQPVSGFFGPLTRAAANALAGGGVIIPPGTNPNIAAQIAALLKQVLLLQTQIAAIINAQSSGSLSASPTSGSAPLTVTFSANLSVAQPASDYSVEFGDGSNAVMNRKVDIMSCSSGTCAQAVDSVYVSHTYSSAGTYTAKLKKGSTQVATQMVTVIGQTITAPTINSLQPTSGLVGTAVTINGSGFAASNSIYLNDTFVETQSNSNGSIPASIKFVIPVGFGEVCYSDGRGCSAKIVNPGNYTISVRNTNGTSNSMMFTVTGGQTVALPIISSISPTTGPVSFTNVTITGTGFTATGNDVHFGTIGGIKNVSSNGTSLTFTVPVGTSACDFSADPQSCTTAYIINPGPYQVSVQNANGISNAMTFTVTGGQTI